MSRFTVPFASLRCSQAPRLGKLCVPGLAIAALMMGCGEGRARTRDEARALLARVEALDPYAPVSERLERLERLRSLTLASEALQRTRDGCVAAQHALLQAEQHQSTARASLERLEGAASGAALPAAPSAVSAVADSIHGSEAATARAAELIPRCNAEIRALVSRYGREPVRLP